MAFLEENCVLDVLTDGILSECRPFTCGDDDMDEFFQKDALAYTRYRMGKSYCFRMKDDAETIVACFTVSNDSIRIYDLPSSRRNAMWKITKREKMLTRYPGVLVGRLAVASRFSGKGIGSEVLDFIRMWFLDDANKTGCRFAIVDAKNEPDVLRFYEKNNFKPLFPREIDEDLYTKPPKDDEEREDRLKQPRKLRTRLMFCDLLGE
ncbi:MAG: GNAT family N-acetyltransferase [Bacteroidaceae bacterium]|nr:GNAT family N-acetyltransferase [Bacteroidaceae bacterium]